MASHDYVLVGTKDGVLLRDPFSSHPMFQEVLIATPEGAMLDVTTAFHEMQLEQLPIPEQPEASRERRATYPDDALRFPASGNLRFPAKPLPSSPKSVTDTLDAMAPPPPPLKLDGDGTPTLPRAALAGRRQQAPREHRRAAPDGAARVVAADALALRHLEREGQAGDPDVAEGAQVLAGVEPVRRALRVERVDDEARVVQPRAGRVVDAVGAAHLAGEHR